MKTYQSFVNCTNNLMCAVDIKTTGPDPDYHEIIQIAILPLDSELKPHRGTKPFYINIASQFPERAKGGALTIGGLDLADLAVSAPPPDKVLDLLVDWFEQLDLPTVHRLIPLAHDWSSKARFLRKWLGNRLFDHIFHRSARDILSAAILQNDMANIRGESTPFRQPRLITLCRQFSIPIERPPDALSVCLVTAKIYKALITRAFD